VQKTLGPVRKAKALDNRLPDPIRGDAYAEQAMRRLDPGYDNRRFGASQVGLHQQRITAYRGLLAAPAGNIKGATAADRQGQAAEPGRAGRLHRRGEPAGFHEGSAYAAGVKAD
jgi:hypothetical protein